ncbi:hypothetical protein CHLNCDRAFT_142283 [Chlorella variabilis]|uniref:Sulfotransferase n=1 Tax=Chlorella variabilis TaxID=554065 RepID=E1Z875_CHLVA|nr:hypothetical protein CHLNCDRAFT_142283 [Chlorella variabilis]EFN58047.1 hypothetical protein CHLNCDRAFT_142283 [Chlorella variabilis]|eukprot:XP_005850149.1 hypothetical protein CHLNCDRAFT_142283 [Chlorella variabilis]
MPEVKDGQPQQRVEKQQQPVAEQRPQTEQQAQQPKTEAQLGARAEPAKFKVEQPHEPEQVEQAHEPEQVEQEEQATLEGQLMGCRTLKTDPIPAVDKSPSLRVLETYTPQQQQQAQQYTAAVGACTDFACLRQANQLPRAPGQFPFPHFLVIGFPKCATTSIYCHLIQHPQVQHPKLKEPHLLTDKCRPSLSNCSVEAQQQYVVEESDWLPEQLAAAFPWLKMAISMREPISQAIAMLLHNPGSPFVHACEEQLMRGLGIQCTAEARAHYSSKLRQWMAFFPREQLHVYEGITAVDAMPGALLHLKSFLGVDESLPSGTLPLTNWKHQRSGPDELGKYWMLRRADYELLVGMARNDTVE